MRRRVSWLTSCKLWIRRPIRDDPNPNDSNTIRDNTLTLRVLVQLRINRRKCIENYIFVYNAGRITTLQYTLQAVAKYAKDIWIWTEAKFTNSIFCQSFSTSSHKLDVRRVPFLERELFIYAS